jgi:hypothetical protein
VATDTVVMHNIRDVPWHNCQMTHCVLGVTHCCILLHSFSVRTLKGYKFLNNVGSALSENP